MESIVSAISLFGPPKDEIARWILRLFLKILRFDRKMQTIFIHLATANNPIKEIAIPQNTLSEINGFGDCKENDSTRNNKVNIVSS